MMHLSRKEFVEYCQKSKRGIYDEGGLPESFPLIKEEEIGRTPRSSYHRYRVVGALFRWDQVFSDALLVDSPYQGRVFDPKYLCADIWGNLYAPGEKRDDVALTYHMNS